MLSRLQGKPRMGRSCKSVVGRLTIEPQTFCGLKEIELKTRKIQRKNQQCVTITQSRLTNLIQNSQAVKKVCGPQKGYGEKRCEIQGGGQEMAVMVG